MFILNQISGIDGFSIADNLRLVVIAAIFIGIVFVLLYLKSLKKGRKAKPEYVQAVNSQGSSGKEKKHPADTQDDFLSIEEEAEDVPVVNLDKTLADIEEMEEGSDTKQEVDTKGVRTEFAAKIEGLISKIENSQKEVVKKVENIVDARVQEVLSKIDDRIDEVIRSQKNTNTLVSVGKINSLPHDEEPVSSEMPNAIEGSSVVSGASDSLRIEESPVGTSSSLGSEGVVEDSSFSLDALDDLPVEESAASSSKIEKSDTGEMAGESEDLDILDFLKEDSIGISLPDESSVNEEMVEELPEEITEEPKEETFESSEVNEGETVEEEESIDSSGINEENVLEVDEGDTADFDIQEFLEEIENIPSEKDSEDEK
jgi:hypothetical protein